MPIKVKMQTPNDDSLFCHLVPDTLTSLTKLSGSLHLPRFIRPSQSSRTTEHGSLTLTFRKNLSEPVPRRGACQNAAPHVNKGNVGDRMERLHFIAYTPPQTCCRLLSSFYSVTFCGPETCCGGPRHCRPDADASPRTKEERRQRSREHGTTTAWTAVASVQQTVCRAACARAAREHRGLRRSAGAIQERVAARASRLRPRRGLAARGIGR